MIRSGGKLRLTPATRRHPHPIEPDLYNPHLGGVRVDDMVIVTEDKCENLSHLHSKVWLDLTH